MTDNETELTTSTPVTVTERSLSHSFSKEDCSPQHTSQLKHRSQNPMDTRLRTGTIPKKSVKVSIVKTVRDANNDVTTIIRALSCEECSKHREVIGNMPRRGPFQSYWDKLMLQA